MSESVLTPFEELKELRERVRTLEDMVREAYRERNTYRDLVMEWAQDLENMMNFIENVREGLS